MNSDGCEYLEWEICASLVIHLSWFWLECPLLCSNDLSLSSKSTAVEVPMLAALLKNSEFERKSCVDEKSLWDICESMSSNIGGDGGAIWRDLDEALNRGLQDDNQTVNQRSSFEQKRLLKPLSSLLYRWDVLKMLKYQVLIFFNCEKINLFPHYMRKHKSVIIKQKVKAAWLKNQ